MRIVMMGTGPFAVPTFESLWQSDHEVVALVTRPTRPAANKKAAPVNPMREAAEAHGLPVMDPEDLNTPAAQTAVAAYAPDLLVVCDYGQILSPESLAVAPLGGINLHGSLLPKYRGAAPVNWAILNGDTETGVTVIHMTPRLDAGPCLSMVRTPLDPEEDAVDLEQRLALLGVDAVGQAMQLLEPWDRVAPLGNIQDQSLATKAPRLRKQDGLLDWSRAAHEVYNQVRGLKPWPGTFTFVPTPKRGNQRVIIDAVAVEEGDSTTAAPGTIVHADARHFRVATATHPLSILQLQPAGKRLMLTEEYLRGNPLQAGQTLAASQ